MLPCASVPALQPASLWNTSLFFAAAVKGLELLTKLDAVQLQASFADLPLSDSSTKEIGIIIVKRCSSMFFLTK
jgi:hypothetical protein